jgi:hypothetical protein
LLKFSKSTDSLIAHGRALLLIQSNSWANPSLDPAQYHVLFESLKIGYAEDGYEERLISVTTSTTNIALELKLQFRVAKPRDILTL